MIALGVDMRAEVAKLKRNLRGLARELLPQAQASATNKVLSLARTAATGALAQATDLPKWLVKNRMRIRKATRKRALGWLWVGTNVAWIKGTSDGLKYDLATGQRERRVKGVVVSTKGRARKKRGRGVSARGRHWPKGFAHSNTYFQREGQPRLPIERLGIPIKSQAETLLPNVVASIAEKRFAQLLERELNFRVQKASRR